MVLAPYNCTCCPWLVKGAAVLAPAEKSVTSMIELLLSVSDWPIIMISPGDLLLLVPHLFAITV
jgi:hypothetical protein